ncbi:MAG: DUF6288 domain-containing protein, partial [Verrucomicrobiota bacterium]
MKRFFLSPIITGLVFLFLSGGFLQAQTVRPDRVYPQFHVGVSGIFATIQTGLNVRVESTWPGSPADGLFNPNDILNEVNGMSLSTNDPRETLGEQIGVAEGTDGMLTFLVDRGGTPTNITVNVPVIGAYATNWPSNCPKTTNIIQSTINYILNANHLNGTGLQDTFSSLFLLSTGDDSYLPQVQTQVYAIAAANVTTNGSGWTIGYWGLLLGEYYLRTGDTNVLPQLQTIVDVALQGQTVGGWGHSIAPPGPGYVQSGLVNSPGATVLIALALARECGVNVDETGFRRSLKFFYRFVGHGGVPYGDHRAERFMSANGKNGMLACALALIDAGPYRTAKEHMALMMADSYWQPESGHTGGGFNIIWRGISAVHVPTNRMHHYRRHMDRMAWYYDLSRHPSGGFEMFPFPEQRYLGASWGVGVSLAYTAPLKTLRITGKPPGIHSVSNAVPSVDWGTSRDLDFLSTEVATGFGPENEAPHEIEDKLSDPDGHPASYFATLMRHYDPTVRQAAAAVLGFRADAASLAEVETALQDPDVRVRRAGLDAVSGYNGFFFNDETAIPTLTVSTQMMPHIQVIIDDLNVSWWEIDGALFALARSEPPDIRTNMPTICLYSQHEEWYLRE